MKKIKLILGIGWAFLCLIIIIVLFPSLNPLANSTSKLPFMKINPNYTGGEVVKEITKGNYTISIHRTIFDGLIGDRKKGFVQIDWRGKLPQTLNDSIDFDSDAKNDFVVQIDTTNANTRILKLNPNVGELQTSTHTSFGWAIRVGLKR